MKIAICNALLSAGFFGSVFAFFEYEKEPAYAICAAIFVSAGCIVTHMIDSHDKLIEQLFDIEDKLK